MNVKELGHLVLYVRDIQRSRTFYRDLLGWQEVGEAFGGRAVAFSSGRTHHELLLIEVGEDAAPIPEPPRVGLYHFGVKVGDSDKDLSEALEQLLQAGIRVTGMSDHGVTHSVYIEDPDGNEIELYVDISDAWKTDPAAVLAPIKPLRL
jgi:catechol 2,3-dioxygenase